MAFSCALFTFNMGDEEEKEASEQMGKKKHVINVQEHEGTLWPSSGTKDIKNEGF